MCCEEKLRMLTPLGVLYVHRLICNWILYHVPLYYLSSCFKEAEDYEIMILKAPMYSIEISKIFTKQFYRRKLNWYFTKSFEKFICLLILCIYNSNGTPTLMDLNLLSEWGTESQWYLHQISGAWWCCGSCKYK